MTEGKEENNRKGEMEVRWRSRGGFQSQQWLVDVFLPSTVSTHLSRGQRGKIKHGSMCVCLRVRWKALNGMTGRSRPSDVLLVCLTQTAGDTRRRDLSGWHGQLQSCTRGIKSDRTRCDKWRPCEGKVCS